MKPYVAAEHPRLIVTSNPKTASSTFQGVLEQNIPDARVLSLHYPTLDEAVGIIRKVDAQGRVDAVVGHVQYGVHAAFDGAPYVYLAMFREPVARIVSLYYFILQCPDHHLHTRFREDRITLKQFVNSKMVMDMDNGQARRISGLAEQYGFGECDEAMLETAQCNLETDYAFFGVTEHFTESIERLAATFGWTNTDITSLNVTPKKVPPEKLPDEIIDAIKSRNRIDAILYRWVLQRFEECRA